MRFQDADAQAVPVDLWINQAGRNRKAFIKMFNPVDYEAAHAT
jgi:hypothetical protein